MAGCSKRIPPRFQRAMYPDPRLMVLAFASQVLGVSRFGNFTTNGQDFLHILRHGRHPFHLRCEAHTCRPGQPQEAQAR